MSHTLPSTPSPTGDTSLLFMIGPATAAQTEQFGLTVEEGNPPTTSDEEAAWSRSTSAHVAPSFIPSPSARAVATPLAPPVTPVPAEWATSVAAPTPLFPRSTSSPTSTTTSLTDPISPPRRCLTGTPTASSTSSPLVRGAWLERKRSKTFQESSEEETTATEPPPMPSPNTSDDVREMTGLLALPPTLRQSFSDGSMPVPAAVPQINVSVPLDPPRSILIPPPIRLPFGVPSYEMVLPRSQVALLRKKRKKVSFASSVKTNDGCSAAAASSSGAVDAATNDQEEERPKQQGLSAEAILRPRHTAVPILRLPDFPKNRASSAPAFGAAPSKPSPPPAAATPTPATSHSSDAVSVATQSVLVSNIAPASSPSAVAFVASHSLPPRSDHSHPRPMFSFASAEVAPAPLTPFVFPTPPPSATSPPSSLFSSPTSAARLSLKRPFQDEPTTTNTTNTNTTTTNDNNYNDSMTAMRDDALVSNTTMTISLSAIPLPSPSPQSGRAPAELLFSSHPLSTEEDDGDEMEDSCVTSPVGPLSPSTSFLGIRTHSRVSSTDEQTAALYSSLLPQPPHSPAAAQSFTSLSLLSSVTGAGGTSPHASIARSVGITAPPSTPLTYTHANFSFQHAMTPIAANAATSDAAATTVQTTTPFDADAMC